MIQWRSIAIKCRRAVLRIIYWTLHRFHYRTTYPLLIQRLISRLTGPIRQLSFSRVDDREGYDKWCAARTRWAALKYSVAIFNPSVSFSILVPVCDPKPSWLKECIASVKNQSYQNWELILCDDASRSTAVRDILKAASATDDRIRSIYKDHRTGISNTTNQAANLAHGDFLLFLDHDDLLDPYALAAFAKAITANKNTQPVDILYADEDFFGDEDRIRRLPCFKPDYSPDLLLATNYIHHPVVMRRELFLRLGGLRSGYDGSQDLDLLLRAAEVTSRIVHVPDVLHHMRVHAGSLSSGPQSKPEAHRRGREAIADALKRRGIEGRVMPAPEGYPGQNVVLRNLPKDFSIGVVIVPDGPVDECEIRGRWRDCTCWIGDANERVPETINSFIESMDKEIAIVASSRIQPVPGWLEAMVPHLLRRDIGLVSGKIVHDSDETLYSCGLVLGVAGAAVRWQHGWPAADPGFCGWMAVDHEVSAVPWPFFGIRRDLFLTCGKLDTDFQSTGFDIDLALRLRKQFDLRHLVVPTAKMRIHKKNTHRSIEDWSLADLTLLWSRWGAALRQGDPYLNPNYTYYKEGIWLSDEAEMMLRHRGCFTAYDKHTAASLLERFHHNDT